MKRLRYSLRGAELLFETFKALFKRSGAPSEWFRVIHRIQSIKDIRSINHIHKSKLFKKFFKTRQPLVKPLHYIGVTGRRKSVAQSDPGQLQQRETIYEV